MLGKLLGSSDVNFKTETGEVVEGKNIYVGFSDEHTLGTRTDKFFVRNGIPFPKNLTIGDDIEIVFNRYGKPEAITAVK